MPQPHQKRVLLIAGPTASGKSALALEVAAAENGVIINADSMQIYRELRILTARPSAEDEMRMPHRLYGHIGAADSYSVGHWVREAVREIEAVQAEGKLPIVCGGTGLYFMALLKGLAEVPAIEPAVREKWRNYPGSLHDALVLRDPLSAATFHPRDHQRLVRALEVLESTGKSLRAWQAEAAAGAPLRSHEVRCWFKAVPRETLYARADARFDTMLEQGALEEVRSLPVLPADQTLQKAIGVTELAAHLAGTLSLDDARARAQTLTRNYIKRQLTWARGQMADWILKS